MTIEQQTNTIDAKPTRARSRTKTNLAKRLGADRLSGVYAWALLVLLFGILIPGTFLTQSTIRTIGTTSTVTLIAALALIIPLACGLFDLSVAATLGLTAVLVLQLQTLGVEVWLSVVISIGVGAAIGAINAFLVVRLGISSFIATLGMSSILAAFTFLITRGVQIVAPIGSSFVAVGQSTFLGVSIPLWFAVILAAVLYYVTELTTVGRYLYAIGGNVEASRLVGIRVGRLQFGSLVCSGLVAAMAGLVFSAQVGSSSATVGPSYLLPAFSAVLLGATQIKTNGRVNVLGTIVAVVLLATGVFGLQLLGAPSYISDLFNGLALIIAVALSVRANWRS